LKNEPAKFHPDPIRNDGAQAFLEEGHPNKNNKMSSTSTMGLGSLPGPKSTKQAGLGKTKKLF